MRTVLFLGKGLTRGWDPSKVLRPGVEKWGMNNLALARFNGRFDDWTRWFEMHPNQHVLKTRPDAYAWYRAQDARRPIYRLTPDPEIPGCRVYPIADVLAKFKTSRFRDSLDYLFALALLEEFERIELCWFPQGDRPEHRRGIPTATYWIGRCEQAGIEVVIHGDSKLQAPTKIYGYDIVYGMLE